MWKPDLLCLDFETTGLDFYRHDFRVKSASLSWFKRDGSIKSRFLVGEENIELFLTHQVRDTPLVVHNAQFELGVLQCRFPNVKVNIAIDTMRLVQNADSGGEGKLQGYKLENCIKRWLPSEFHDHKKPYFDWIVDNLGVKPSEAGKHLSRLPANLLEEYNIADTELTLRLYKQLVDFFKGIGHDWKLDHQLYINSCRLLAQSKSRGVLVDRVRLAEEIAKIEVDLVHSEADFRQKFAAQIEDIEAKNISAWLDELKTERGRDKRREALEADRSGVMDKAKLKFNIKSPSQKELLFVKYLGIQPTFKTPTGSPSFKDSHLKSYGEGGEMLAGRGNLQFVKSQAESLLVLTEYDSRWHLDMKATGAKTSRMSGGRAD